MQLVADLWHLHAAGLLAEVRGLEVDVEGHQRVRFFRGRVEGDHVSQRLDGSFPGEARRRIEGLVWSE
ncbi:MAG TPA: hypothetical protein VND96_01010 [Candidatus Micrarchaeaceae archaeon]|nr:hypothetical protein [Candidatus Micrarchaeaceae archaeon]